MKTVPSQPPTFVHIHLERLEVGLHLLENERPLEDVDRTALIALQYVDSCKCIVKASVY